MSNHQALHSSSNSPSRDGASTPLNDANSIFTKEKPADNDSLNLPSMREKSWKDHLLISTFCLFVAFGGFVFGFDTGTISGFVNMDDFLQRFGSQAADGSYYLSDVRTGLMVSIFNIGCAVGGIFLSKTADLYGRRMGIMIAMAIYVVGIIIQIASQLAWYQYFIGRLVSGLAVGTVSVLCPLFISETAPKQVRGTLVVCFQLFITMGIFLGYCTTYGTKSYTDSRQWRIPLGLCFAWAIFLVVGMLCMPESPRYLIEKEKIEEAKRSIGRSNNHSPEDPGVYTEVLAIQAGLERERLEGKATWKELIVGKPKIFRRVLMGIIMQSLQQLTGNNYFFYYGTTVFRAVGLQDSFETSIIIGVVNFASTFVGIYTIERFGRRLTLMVGSVSMFVCMIIFSVIGTVHLFRDDTNDPTNTYVASGNAMIFITCLYIFFFASTWAGGVYTIVSESYPLRIRSKSMSVATAANWLWGFLISFFTPFITSAINFSYGFVFAGCLLFSLFYVYFFVYETRGLTLEEVDQLYASDLSAWNSAKFVPQKREDAISAAAKTNETKPVQEHMA